VAKLFYNSDLTILSEKVVKTLANRSCGTEDIAYRCCTNRDSIRARLAQLKAKGVVEHDGRRPRTWKLKEPEAA
jgi:predicted transcriptional regulator